VHEDEGGDVRTKQGLEAVMEIAKRVGRFDENVLFQGENANVRDVELRLACSLQVSINRSLKRNSKSTSGTFRGLWIVWDVTNADSGEKFRCPA
jgi:hypothetical protein